MPLINVRRAGSSDHATLVNLDQVRSTVRSDEIERWLALHEVFVADIDGAARGYAVLARYAYWGRDALEMLTVGEPYRGQGIGERLIRNIEAIAKTKQLIATTNLSNHRMQNLLGRLGYVACGFVDQLDPGDPEIIYAKGITPNT
jgi:GNAT superfamily N-acetyltransferase